MTVTAATSATPIISADAVIAVRPGARIALRRASLAAEPPVAAIGRPMAPTTLRTTRAGRRRRCDDGSASRSASTGATRVARHAGSRPAISVTSMPTSSATITVRDANTIPASGRSSSIALKSALSPLARPIAGGDAHDRARAAPIASASSITERSTCRRDAPTMRSRPNSRERWATVIESVLKIVNAPTSIATPAEARSARP